MPLFHVQDSDRPLYVVAKNYGEAEYKWREIIAIENTMFIKDIEPPLGISFICKDNDLITNKE